MDLRHVGPFVLVSLLVQNPMGFGDGRVGTGSLSGRFRDLADRVASM
jgi:hypothetical protein